MQVQNVPHVDHQLLSVPLCLCLKLDLTPTFSHLSILLTSTVYSMLLLSSEYSLSILFCILSLTDSVSSCAQHFTQIWISLPRLLHQALRPSTKALSGLLMLSGTHWDTLVFTLQILSAPCVPYHLQRWFEWMLHRVLMQWTPFTPVLSTCDQITWDGC